MTPLQRLATREFFGIKLGLDTIARARRRPRSSRARFSSRHRRWHQRQGLGHRHGRRGPCTRPDCASAATHRHIWSTCTSATRSTTSTSPTRSSRLRYRRCSTPKDALLANGALTGPATYFELTTAAAFVLFRAARRAGGRDRGRPRRTPRRDQRRRRAVCRHHLDRLRSHGAARRHARPDCRREGRRHRARRHRRQRRHRAEPAAVIAGRLRRRRAPGSCAPTRQRDVEAEQHDGETTLRLTDADARLRPGAPRRCAAHIRSPMPWWPCASSRRWKSAGVGGGATAIDDRPGRCRWPGRLERRALPNGVASCSMARTIPAGAEALARWLRTARLRPDDARHGLHARQGRRRVAGATAAARHARGRHRRGLPAGAAGRRTRGAQSRRSRRDCPCRSRRHRPTAMAAASEGSARVVVAGSLFLVGAVRAWLDDTPGPARSRVIFCGSLRPTSLPSPCTRS